MKVYPYGICLAAAVLAGLLAFLFLSRRHGLKRETAGILFVLAIPLGLLLARLAYCLCRLTWFGEQGLGWYFRFTEGGFMFYGAAGGVLLACLLCAKITGQRLWHLTDVAAVPALLTYGIGRIGDLLAGQGYGWPVGDWFSVEAFDPEEYTGMSLFHLEDASFFEGLPFSVEDAYYGNFRWAVALWIGAAALVLCVVLYRLTVRREGSRTVMLAAFLCALTVMMESMRQDDLMRWGVVRVGQIVSAVLLAALVVICEVRAGASSRRSALIADWVWLLSGMGLVMVAEFMLEKKIVFLDFVPMDGCYVLMILACIWMGLAVHAALKRQDAA